MSQAFEISSGSMPNSCWIDVGAEAVERLCDVMVGRLNVRSIDHEKAIFTAEQMHVLKAAFADAFSAFAKLVDGRLLDMENKLVYISAPIGLDEDVALRADLSADQGKCKTEAEEPCLGAAHKVTLCLEELIPVATNTDAEHISLNMVTRSSFVPKSSTADNSFIAEISDSDQTEGHNCVLDKSDSLQDENAHDPKEDIHDVYEREWTCVAGGKDMTAGCTVLNSRTCFASARVAKRRLLFPKKRRPAAR